MSDTVEEDRPHGHAVIVGGSIGGLLAARVLSETFAQVTVLDRDTLPDESVPRRGVPQGHHTHGLLARGGEILDELFPGFTAGLVGLGAVPCDSQNDCRWYNEGHRLHPAPSRLRALAVSRPLLETYLRSRVAALTNVRIRARQEVIGLIGDDGHGRVRGVRSVTAEAAGAARAAGAEAEELPADLVVNATGRGNRGAVWLRELGYEAAPEERVDSGLVYVTREYRDRPDDADVAAVLIGHSVTVPRGGFAIRAEGGRWMITMLGMRDDIPSTVPEAYERFAGRLPAPDIDRLVRRLEPLGPPRLMRIPTSVRRRYERLDRFPEGYIVLGDALCQFNPSYGQGMTVAACEAMALRDALRDGRSGVARRYFELAARVIDVPWDMAVGGDLRFPWIEGRRTARVRLLNAYIGRLHRAAEHDPVVGNAFLSVANLTVPPQRLFAPPILARVLRPRRGRRTPVRTPGAPGAPEIPEIPGTAPETGLRRAPDPAHEPGAGDLAAR